MRLSIVGIFLLFSSVVFADQRISAQIQKEFNAIQKVAAKAKAEFKVGGYLNGKSFGDYELLWRLERKSGDYDVIRIFRDKGNDQQAFTATYYLADHIVPGRTVIRRFIGPAQTGWRNDTIDAKTGEYLGQQGSTDPSLDTRDFEILKDWEIELP